MPKSLGEAFPEEQARVREIWGHYKEIGPDGAFAAHWIGEVLKRAEEVVGSQDVIQMIAVFKELKEVKEPVTEEIDLWKRLLRRTLMWRNMDGDGITDPLREDIKRAIGGR